MKPSVPRASKLLGPTVAVAALIGCVSAPLKSHAELCSEDGFEPGTAEFESCVEQRRNRAEQARRTYDLFRPQGARP